jgi:two-component system response regulator PilR (NtrC family)
VRELENVIERAVALAGARAIGLGDLPPELSGVAGAPTPALLTLPQEGTRLDDVLGEVERRLILAAMERTGGVRKRAAELLGITFRSLRYRLKKQGLGDEDDEETDA